MKDKIKRIGRFLKRHLKLIILLVFILAAVIGVLTYINKNKRAEVMSQSASIKTAQIEKRTITNSISLTGSIASAQSRTITTTLGSVEVLNLNVEKGDVVEAGDTLLIFDTADIEKDIASAKEDISQSEQSDALAKQGADRELAYTTDSQLTAAQKAAKAVTDAEADLADACDAYGDATSSLSELKDAASGKKSAYDAALNSYNNLKSKSVSSNTVATSTEDGTVTEEEIAVAQAAVTTAEEQVASAQAAYEAAKSEYETASKSAESAETKVTSATSEEKNAQKTYDNAVQEQESTVKSGTNSILSQQESYAKTMLTLDDTTEELKDKLDDYEKELKKYTVTAPISGIVTEVNAEAGSVPSGGSLITIEDCEGFTVTAEVDEYDISDISVGMEVVIKTDATGDEELSGVISYVSPTPTETSASGSSDVTYEIKIDILTANDRLRLGMTAKLSIVLESRANVLTVPYNCIEENESGESVIYVLDEPSGGSPAQDSQADTEQEEKGSQADTEQQEKDSQADAEQQEKGSQADAEQQAQENQDGSRQEQDAQGSSGLSGSADSSPALSRKAVVVEVGLESDYYVEVTGEGLREGMRVIVPTDATQGTETQSDAMPAGIGGGMGQGMPGGGGGRF